MKTTRLALVSGAGVSLILAATIGLAGVLAAPSHNPEPGSSALRAREILLRAAANADQQPDKTGRGKYRYVEVKSWSLMTAIIGQTVQYSRSPLLTQRWIAADGSGRVRTLIPEAHGPAVVRTNKVYGVHQLQMIWRSTLSANPQVLRHQLELAHPAELGDAETLVAIRDLYDEQPVRPPVAAAILKILAQLKGIRYRGTIVDRMGRHGFEVSLDSNMTDLLSRCFLVFDKSTGQLLDSEIAHIRPASYRGVRIPAIIGYSAYISSYRTNHL